MYCLALSILGFCLTKYSVNEHKHTHTHKHTSGAESDSISLILSRRMREDITIRHRNDLSSEGSVYGLFHTAYFAYWEKRLRNGPWPFSTSIQLFIQQKATLLLVARQDGTPLSLTTFPIRNPERRRDNETANGCVEKEQSYKHWLWAICSSDCEKFSSLSVKLSFVCLLSFLIPWLRILKIVQGTERKGNNCCIGKNEKLLWSGSWHTPQDPP